MASQKQCKVKAHLRKLGCASGKELAQRFSISLRRLNDYLRRLGCLTSYSHKRRFYTLPGKPRFNKQRIWKCKRTGALFTDLGSLKALVEWHVRKSPAGLTCQEISRTTGVRVEPHIVRISRECGLVRQKFDGEYVYFYRPNEKIYSTQLAKRKRLASKAGPGSENTVDGDVEDLKCDLQIALALLNYPGKSAPGIVALLRKKGIRVTMNDLAGFLVRHDIKKKMIHQE